METKMRSQYVDRQKARLDAFSETERESNARIAFKDIKRRIPDEISSATMGELIFALACIQGNLNFIDNSNRYLQKKYGLCEHWEDWGLCDHCREKGE